MMLMGRPSVQARNKVEKYFNALGVTCDLTFRLLPHARLALISADLENGATVIYGENPGDSVLEGLLASIAIPPWFTPLRRGGRIIIDGGALSNLPIEPALRMGATEIIALDLDDPPPASGNPTLTDYFSKYLSASNRRQILLEMQIAEMRGVPVRHIDFKGLAKTPIWDFSDFTFLRQAGYERAKKVIAGWSQEFGPDLARHVPDQHL